MSVWKRRTTTPFSLEWHEPARYSTGIPWFPTHTGQQTRKLRLRLRSLGIDQRAQSEVLATGARMPRPGPPARSPDRFGRTGRYTVVAGHRPDRRRDAAPAPQPSSARSRLPRKIETGRLPSPAFGTIVCLCETLDMPVRELASAWRGNDLPLEAVS